MDAIVPSLCFAADRTIKIWDMASGQLKLTLTGHIEQVRRPFRIAVPWVVLCQSRLRFDEGCACFPLTLNCHVW
jgi:WD40 repeat protein